MADDSLQVIQISDTHLQAQPGSRLWGVDVDRGLVAVLKRIQERHWPADMLLATGDLVQDEGFSAYQRFREILEPLSVPVYCLPGNHDSPAILDKSLADGRVRRERHIIRKNWQFILLDSTVPGSPGGYLSATELDFLHRTLAHHPNHHALISLHHQPLAIGSAWLDTMKVANGEDLFAIIDRHPQVRAVIWGHIHQEFTGRHRDVILLGAPSTCVQFKPGSETAKADDLPPGYRWFVLNRDGSLATGVERVAFTPV